MHTPRSSPVARLSELLGELGDLKRVRSADQIGSFAERGFAAAWAALTGGACDRDVMGATVAAAVAAARLGDLDAAKLHDLGLGGDDVRNTLLRSVNEHRTALDPVSHDVVLAGLDIRLPRGQIPDFVRQLAAQPRAGATCPGKPRLIFEPPENHAEHSWAVAIFGVLLAPHYGAEPERVFLAGLSHHLHNALVPDSGLTGEMLLGDRLQDVCDRAAGRALAALPVELRSRIVSAREILSDAATPEGRAFHAADVIDRVLQLAQHLRAARLDLAVLLDEWQLVHAGPVKDFHDAVLAEAGLC